MSFFDQSSFIGFHPGLIGEISMTTATTIKHHFYRFNILFFLNVDLWLSTGVPLNPLVPRKAQTVQIISELRWHL
jgi:hypothetical protein